MGSNEISEPRRHSGSPKSNPYQKHKLSLLRYMF
jgi:hypothetical protein